MKGEKS